MAVRTTKSKVTTGDREVDERQPVFKDFDDRTEKHPRASILSHFADCCPAKKLYAAAAMGKIAVKPMPIVAAVSKPAPAPTKAAR